MISDSLLTDDKFWMAIEFLEGLGHPILISDIFGQLPIDEADLTAVLEFLKDFNYQVEKDKDTGKMMLYPPEDRQHIIYDFSMPQLYLIRKIEESFAKGKNLQVEFFSRNKQLIHVHLMVFLDGELSIVGEDVQTGQLDSWEIKSIQDIKIDLQSKYIPRYGEIEVNDFVKAHRSIGENEVRLVLKFSRSTQAIDPRFHFLGNPFVTTNWNGDKIWAASVEISDYLYQWLLSVHENIEIMDPESVKKGLYEYCRRKVEEEKKDLKKVS